MQFYFSLWVFDFRTLVLLFKIHSRLYWTFRYSFFFKFFKNIHEIHFKLDKTHNARVKNTIWPHQYHLVALIVIQCFIANPRPQVLHTYAILHSTFHFDMHFMQSYFGILHDFCTLFNPHTWIKQTSNFTFSFVVFLQSALRLAELCEIQ